MVEAEGLSAVTVRGVCTRAKLTSRYFYESFASSQELLTALYDELAEQAMSSALTTLALGDPQVDIAHIQESMSAGIDRLEEAAPSIRFLLSHATADPVLNARRRRFVALVSGRMAEASARSRGLPHAPGWLVSRARFVLGGMIELTTAYVEGELDRGQLIETLAEQVALLGGAGRQPAT